MMIVYLLCIFHLFHLEIFLIIVINSKKYPSSFFYWHLLEIWFSFAKIRDNDKKIPKLKTEIPIWLRFDEEN